MKKYTFLFVCSLFVCACSHQSAYIRTSQREVNQITASAAFPLHISLPTFPSLTMSVIDFGADATGSTFSTDAFQTTINAVSAQGGGTVEIPAGIYKTGPIVLQSNVCLYTEPNSFILFDPDIALYPLYDTSFEGLDTRRCQSPISAFDAENIAIVGYGTFNGSGDSWRPLKRSKVTDAQWKKQLARGGVVSADGKIWYPDEGARYAASLCVDQNIPIVQDDSIWTYIHSFLRPVMLHLVNCRNILLEGVCFENSPAWNLHPLMCTNIVLSHLTVRNPWYSQNGDGVDIESCSNVLITDCSFDVGDDAICMKSGKNEDGRRRGIPTERVLVNNCIVYHGHGGFVVGSEMSGGVRDVEVQNCLFLGTDVGLRFKSTRGRGGVVENIYVHDVNMWGIPHEALVFDLFYGGKGAGEETEEELLARLNASIPPVTEETPAFRHIVIEDIIANDVVRAAYFNGLPEMPIENVTLRHIRMSAKHGALFRHTDTLTIEDMNVTAAEGEPIVFSSSVKHITQL